MQGIVSCGSTVLSSPASQWMFEGLHDLKLLKLHTSDKESRYLHSESIHREVMLQTKDTQILDISEFNSLFLQNGIPSSH